MAQEEGLLSFYLNFLSNKEINEIKDNSNIGLEDIVKKEENEIYPSNECITNSKKKYNKQQKPKTTKAKSFDCTFDNCNKKFEYKWVLDRHINSHFCFKLFKCNYGVCNKAYKSKENLDLHYKNKHLGEKPFKCSYCPCSFSHRNGINLIKIRKNLPRKKNSYKLFTACL